MKDQPYRTLQVAEFRQQCGGKMQQHPDHIANEVPIALVYNGISHAVLMATPEKLPELALGFSFTEGIVTHPDEIFETEIVIGDDGIEVRLTIAAERFIYLKERRRNLAGRTGCGICGAESLQQIKLAIEPVDSSVVISHTSVQHASARLASQQPILAQTGAVHAAAWCDTNGEIKMLCEDVGRHNALDKLVGSLILQKQLSDPGFLLISSRASYEMVQKAAAGNIAIIVAVSAATAMAVDIAQQCGICLVGFSRGSRHVVYSHGERLKEN